MAADAGFAIKGLDDVKANIGRLADAITTEVGAAMRTEYEIEMTEAKRRTPVDTGALRGSGHVTGPKRSGNTLKVMLGFGGPAAPYALRVHEDMEVWHRVGQAKFLESTILESVPYMAGRIARRIVKIMRDSVAGRGR